MLVWALNGLMEFRLNRRNTNVGLRVQGYTSTDQHCIVDIVRLNFVEMFLI